MVLINLSTIGRLGAGSDQPDRSLNPQRGHPPSIEQASKKITVTGEVR